MPTDHSWGFAVAIGTFTGHGCVHLLRLNSVSHQRRCIPELADLHVTLAQSAAPGNARRCRSAELCMYHLQRTVRGGTAVFLSSLFVELRQNGVIRQPRAAGKFLPRRLLDEGDTANSREAMTICRTIQCAISPETTRTCGSRSSFPSMSSRHHA